MSSYPAELTPLSSLSDELASQLQARIESVLQDIIKSNVFTTQLGRNSETLAKLRQELTGVDLDDPTACAKAFAAADISLTDYEQYTPYIAKFSPDSPSQLSDVVDLLAPGLPMFFGMSSSTSGKASKLVPKYANPEPPFYLGPETTPFMGKPSGKNVTPVYSGFARFVEVCGQDETKHISVNALSAYWVRSLLGFTDSERDYERLSEPVPGLVAPWGAHLISNYRSIMLTHAAFALAEPHVDTLALVWSTATVDFFRWIDEEWETLIGAIDSGKLPQYPQTEHVYAGIATQFHANPKRAEELRKIGPPSLTAEGWAPKVWPKLGLLVAICTGTFARVLPQVRAYIGPDVLIRVPMYASTECFMGTAYDDRIHDVIKMVFEDYIELLEINADGSDGDLKQPASLFLRFHGNMILRIMGDVVEAAGFSPVDGTPLIHYKERRNQSMRLPHALISQADILASVANIEEFRQTEFTTWLDDRQMPPTVGFFVEANAGSTVISPSVRDSIMASLVEANENFAVGAKKGSSVKPTIRVLAPGAFSEFRRWKGEINRTGSSQIKLPLIMIDTKGQEFLLSRVVDEVH
ncbi:hypothetical protein CONPUDRAFT_154129 [Coniophora puteana RWD-64-598 SS2]|uniref:GH3 auxin-responsive promoter n=1 Tax=Coniophora puteana (strain RWD-64-598) TaxID=741705 RepID=A0A5M3MRA6_CONPW|nr:uncharacterized protein CONPUDRAFT_154129 [Coniophora puteana RWD-64-598 SS2]EIW81597.1 hypothetical protein CONPUDRAFT_154129 [Coniophora puteana RWD-64-598 SS2]